MVNRAIHLGTSWGSSSYVGPGDLQTYTAWYGLRAYNAAYATGSNPALILVDQAGANQITINILATGALDTASISSWVSTNSVTTIKVKQIYDQVGSKHIRTPGAGGTLANMPTLVLNGFGSNPVIHFDGSGPQSLNSQGTALGLGTEPCSLYAVAKATTTNTTKMIVGTSSPPIGIFYGGAATYSLYDGGGVIQFENSGTYTDGNFYTIQAVLNGNSSKGQIHTSLTTGITGAGTTGLGADPSMSNDSFAATMDWMEGGFASGDASSTFTSINSNAKTYWGY